MGLSTERFWGLCDRTFHALAQQLEQRTERDMRVLATIRADLHNTSAREFSRHFSAEDFMGGYFPSVEQRIKELIADGYEPSEAAAIATSRQTREDKIAVIDQAAREIKHRKRA